MTQVKSRRIIYLDIHKESIYLHPFDDKRSKRLASRLHELDREYENQLINLKKVAKKVRQDFISSL